MNYPSDVKLAPVRRKQQPFGLGNAESRDGQRSQRFREERAGVTDAGGNLTLDFGAPDPGTYWDIERIVVRGAGTVTFYLNIASPNNILDETTAPNVADNSSPMMIPDGARLIAVYSAAGAGVSCYVNIQGMRRWVSG